MLATCDTMRSFCRMNDASSHNVHAEYATSMRGDPFLAAEYKPRRVANEHRSAMRLSSRLTHAQWRRILVHCDATSQRPLSRAAIPLLLRTEPHSPRFQRGLASAALDPQNSGPYKRQSCMNTVTNIPNSKNLVDTAAANGSFETFGKALDRAGMTETLRGAGPFTVFAPTDAAFEKLPAGKLESLFKPENKEELVSLLNYHVVSGRKTTADIGKWEAARTVNGQSAPIILKDDQLSIDGALVTSADIGSSNGLIHGIDKVNMPTKQ